MKKIKEPKAIKPLPEIINALLMQNLFHSKNKFHLSALTNHIIVCKFEKYSINGYNQHNTYQNIV